MSCHIRFVGRSFPFTSKLLVAHEKENVQKASVMKRSGDLSGNPGASQKLPRLSSPKESTTAGPIEIKSLLQKKLLQRISSSERRATQREKDQGVTENGCYLLLEEGYSSEVASIDNRDSLFLGERERDRTELIPFVLVVYPSKKSNP